MIIKLRNQKQPIICEAQVALGESVIGSLNQISHSLRLRKQGTEQHTAIYRRGRSTAATALCGQTRTRYVPSFHERAHSAALAMTHLEGRNEIRNEYCAALVLG